MTRLLIVTTVALTMKGFLLPFARHYRKLGWRVDGMADGIAASPECAGAFDRVIDINWSRNPMNPLNILVAPRNILRVIQEGQYDLIHVHTPVAAFVTRCTVRCLRSPRVPSMVYTAHGFHFNAGSRSAANLAFLTLEKIAGRWTDYLVIMNDEDRVLAEKHRIVPSDRLVYMPGIGVDTASVSPDAVPHSDVRAVREQMGLSDRQTLLSMLAAFEPRKRHHDVLHALARVENPDVHLALAGAGPLMPQMRDLAVQLGISSRVTFLGHCQDPRALIRASAATVLPSAREGLSRSVLESLSLAVPVIGTNVKGIRDVLINGCGLLVNTGDVTALGNAFTWIADYPEQARAMGQLGRRQMAAYDIAKVIDMHDELYARALGASGTLNRHEPRDAA